MDALSVWRFDDGLVRSHVIAATQVAAVDTFDRVMGREYREADDIKFDIYRIPGDTVLPIDVDGRGEFVNKTADEWIDHHHKPCFL